MNVRRFQPEDHAEICEWWKHYDWQPVQIELLPNIGFVIEHDGVNIVAGWLYQTDSKIGWIEWIISNPKAPHREKTVAIDLLLKAIIDAAHIVGMKAIFGSLKHKGLMRKYEGFGFLKTDTDVSHFIKILGG